VAGRQQVQPLKEIALSAIEIPNLLLRYQNSNFDLNSKHFEISIATLIHIDL